MPSTLSRSAPSSAPGTVPIAPAMLVPPMIAAAITASSMPWPRVGDPEPRRAEVSTPASAAALPLSTYTITSTRLMLMPALRAAPGLPPVARSDHPKFVR